MKRISFLFQGSRLWMALICLNLSGCGFFTPVYGTANADYAADGGNVTQELIAIKVAPIADKIGHDLHSQIEGKLNPQSIQIDPRYILNITLSKSESPQAIRPDHSASRMQIQVVVNYVLQEIESGQTLTKGVLNVTGSYNRVTSGFGSYSSQQDALLHLAQDIADELYLRALSVFYNRQQQLPEVIQIPVPKMTLVPIPQP